MLKKSFYDSQTDDCKIAASTAKGPSAITCISTALIKYNYNAQQPDELSLTKGSSIKVLEKSDDGWWKGYLDGVIGWFPSNYVVEQTPSYFNNESFTNAQSIIDGNNKFTTTKTTTAESLAKSALELEVKLNLNEKVWYHGVMNRQQCDQLLNAYAEDGDFLVRNSETSAGDFSVSLKAPMRNKHFRVHYVNDSFCVGQRTFSSLDELVEHYKRTPIYTSASGEKMFLKKPYCR